MTHAGFVPGLISGVAHGHFLDSESVSGSFVYKAKGRGAIVCTVIGFSKDSKYVILWKGKSYIPEFGLTGSFH